MCEAMKVKPMSQWRPWEDGDARMRDGTSISRSTPSSREAERAAGGQAGGPASPGCWSLADFNTCPVSYRAPKFGVWPAHGLSVLLCPLSP